ncbi:hypothetical protein FAM23868_001966 [Propionibacterium freudenreichii]|uniref:hypothetical protein n=1 Tax=Propionibacterium freudenreichii TaxID=1744 RepID=UPI00254B99A7|nr:hypothetical protein [Propionibacterium freudenreichii]MDK9332626.1 hypothetical protein [Propionibacterium freudenreichii]
MSAELRDLSLTTRVPDAVAAMLARRDIDTDPCPALHVIAGLTPWADLQPRHALGADGRCRYCHTTIPTIKGA